MTEEQEPIIQSDFDSYEDKKIEESEKNKMIWFGEKHLPLKQRIYQFVATVFMVLAKNFMSKIKWQFGLVGYLIIVCPVGTYTSIKWIINKFIH